MTRVLIGATLDTNPWDGETDSIAHFGYGFGGRDGSGLDRCSELELMRFDSGELIDGYYPIWMGRVGILENAILFNGMR